jgi:radical SAM protein with 4Fe4S-binding SPASM domain
MKNFSNLNRYLKKIVQDTAYINLRAFVKSFTLTRFLNFARINLQYFIGSAKVVGHPYTLVIDTNNICNLRCHLCPSSNNQIKRRNGVMSYKDFKKILYVFERYIFILYLYAWGEPFLTHDIFRMIKYAKSKNIYVSISTNFNISAGLIQSIVDSQLDHLIISLDGTNKITYTKYRKDGDFNLVIANIKSIVKLKKRLRLKYPLIQLQFLVFKHNQGQIPQIIKLAKSLGVDFIDIVKGWSDNKTIQPTDLKNLQEKDIIKLKRCIYPWSKISVSWDGGISPCCFPLSKKDDLGNIKQTSFNKIWNNHKFAEIRKQQTDHNKMIYTTICSRCGRINRKT